MFKKLENLIVLLVAISVVAIVMYKFVPRQLTIRPDSGWSTRAADDRVEAGNSISLDLTDNSQFAFSYNLSLIHI